MSHIADRQSTRATPGRQQVHHLGHVCHAAAFSHCPNSEATKVPLQGEMARKPPRTTTKETDEGEGRSMITSGGCQTQPTASHQILPIFLAANNLPIANNAHGALPPILVQVMIKYERVGRPAKVS